MRGSFEALNLFVEIPDLAERLGPRLPFDERARFLEDPDRLREVVPLQLQIEQLAPGFAHLLLYEIGDVSLEAFGRLLPDAGRGFDVPPFQRLARLAQEALRGRDIHPHCAYFMCEAVPLLDRLPRIVEILRLGLKSVEDDLVGVPGAVVVAGFHPADGLQESRSDEADAGLSLRRSNLLDETLDSFADEVHEGDIEGTPGVRDQCDRALDVAPLPRLDGVVDDPLPFVDFESDPFRGDQEGFHLVRELRELSVEQLPVPGRNPTLRLFSGLTEGVQPTLQGGTGRFRGRRCEGDGRQSRRPSRRRHLHGPRNCRSRLWGRGRTAVVGKAHSAVGALVCVRRHGRLAHGAFVLGRGSFGEFGSASRADGGARGDEGLADGAGDLLAEFPRGRHDRSGIGSRGGLSSFWGVARDALQRFDDFPMVFLAVHDRGEDLVDAPAVPDGNLNGLLRTAREVEQGQVGLARRAHPSVRLDGRIADGTDLRFFRWRKPTPRLVDVFSILEQRTKTFGTQSRE